jgi:hypothetical protein
MSASLPFAIASALAFAQANYTVSVDKDGCSLVNVSSFEAEWDTKVEELQCRVPEGTDFTVGFRVVLGSANDPYTNYGAELIVNDQSIGKTWGQYGNLALSHSAKADAGLVRATFSVRCIDRAWGHRATCTVYRYEIRLCRSASCTMP